MRFSSVAALAAVTGAFAMAGPSLAKDYFEGKTITVVVPSGSGGTFHIYCQLLQRHMGRHIPGKPDMIIQNRPGAGGAKSARFMMTAAPKDGTMIAMINPGTTMTPVLRPGIGYDSKKFQWLGALSVRTYTIATYKGGGAINLAMERGEVEGRTNYYSGYLGVRPHWIENRQLNFLATIGPARPEVKDVPRIRDMVKSGINREMLDLLESNFNVGQGFYVPPGVPKDVVAILRKSFDSLVKDPEMLKEAAARKVPAWSRSWQEVEEAVSVGYGSRKEVSEKLATILGFRKDKK